MVQICFTVGLICWIITSFMFTTMLGAMFSPDKEKLTTRVVLSSLFFIPCLVLVPLGFAAFIILSAIAFIIGITIFGFRIALELIVDGIPEMDDNGKIVERSSPTAPWV